ncbi:MAG: cytochrome b [Ramlibacter sp.]
MDRHSAPAQAFHWLTAVLVLAAFLYGPGGSEERVYSHARDFGRQLHETLGMSVLLLSLARVAWRLVDRRPDPVVVPKWMGRTATVVQGVLFVLLFAVPLAGIAGAWLEGHPLTLLGGLEVSPWVGTAHDAGATIAELHTWLGDAILWLAGAHAAGALLHHFVLRDAVLVSMLPRWLVGRR